MLVCNRSSLADCFRFSATVAICAFVLKKAFELGYRDGYGQAYKEIQDNVKHYYYTDMDDGK